MRVSRAEALDRLLELQREQAAHRARGGLLNFIKYCKPEYEVHWHHRLICRELNKLVRGENKRLMIFTPPRHGKSEIISRHLPAYLLGLNPDMRVISASYAATLAESMNRDVQRVITSPAYRELFPGTRLQERNIRQITDTVWLRNSETFEVVNRRGYYLCAGVGGPLTGRGGDCGLVDDVIKNSDEAYSEAYRARVWDWYTSVFLTRLSKGAPIAITMTRWHDDDLAGRLLEQARNDPKADQWVVINLPALKEDEPTELDPREPGEALWPEHYSVEHLEAIRAANGRMFASLYQGRPSPADGEVIRRNEWRYYDLPQGPELPEFLATFEWLVCSADLTFKDRETSDYCVFQVWGRRGANKYLLHQVRKRLNYPAQKAALRELLQSYPVNACYVEDAANAAALVSELKDTVEGLIPVKPEGTKLARARAITPQAEAGQLHLPDPKAHPWVVEFIEEWAKFPAGKDDDQVDACSLAVSQLRQSGGGPIEMHIGGKAPLYVPGAPW